MNDITPINSSTEFIKNFIDSVNIPTKARKHIIDNVIKPASHTKTIRIISCEKDGMRFNYLDIYCFPTLGNFYIKDEYNEESLKDPKTKFVIKEYPEIQFGTSYSQSNVIIKQSEYSIPVITPLKGVIELFVNNKNIKSIDDYLYSANINSTISSMLKIPPSKTLISGILGIEDVFFLKFIRRDGFGRSISKNEDLLITPFWTKTIFPSVFGGDKKIYSILKSLFNINIKENGDDLMNKLVEKAFVFDRDDM